MAMSTADAGTASSCCKECGHCKTGGRQSTKKSWKKGKSSNGDRQPKWCSLHRTTTHSDAECLAQHKKQEELKGLAANLALLGVAGPTNFAHLGSALSAQPSQAAEPQASQAPSEPTSFGFSFNAIEQPPAAATTSTSNTETPSVPKQDQRLPEGYFGAF